MLLPGLGGSALGELITKGKVSRGRVGNRANVILISVFLGTL